MTALIVENDPSLIALLSKDFRDAGFDVETADDGSEGIAKCLRRNFDLIVVDWMLPTMLGTEVCRRLRECGAKSAILMLTAHVGSGNRVDGLQIGANAYLAKPFSREQLRASINSLLRLTTGEDQHFAFSFDDITVDFRRRELKKSGRAVRLRRKEWQVLRYLILHQQQIIRREELLKVVWGLEPGIEFRSLDVHIAGLRKKIEVHPQSPRHIHTIRGTGFRFTP